MKKLTVIVLALVACLGGTIKAESIGSSFGTLTSADALGQGRGDFSFGLGLADATSFVGGFAYGLSEYTDGRIRVALVDRDGSDTKFTIGGDVKWQFWEVGPESTQPIDLAVGGLFEYGDFDLLSVFQIGGQLIGSYPFALKNGGKLEPYARFNFRLESISIDYPAGIPARFRGDDSESNLEIGLNGGVKWDATDTIALYGEFQVDGNDGVFFGVDLNVM